MSASKEGGKRYQCVTQEGTKDSRGKADEAKLAQPDNIHKIVIGSGPIIPRWSGTAANPAKLLYFGVREGFPKDEDFTHAVDSFQAAADEWNAIKFGVTINRTTDRTKANFVLVYYKPPPAPPGSGNVIASAFFPNRVKDVRCYDFALTDAHERKYLKNTFLHEIGHIIGLRHEFAIKRDARGHGPESFLPAVQLGAENAESVMSYEPINYIQESDKQGVLDFYKLPNRREYSGAMVTDFVPKPLPVTS